MAKRKRAKRKAPAKRKGTYVGFRKLRNRLARSGRVRNPDAVAASIGRKKYGRKGMAKKAAAGRRRKRRAKR